MLKDLCLKCGVEHPLIRPIDRSNPKCCGAPHLVHQEACKGCGQVLGAVVGDDFCGVDEAYCSICMSTARRGRAASSESA